MLIIKKGEGSSSGGDTPPSGGSNIEYLDVRELPSDIRNVLFTLSVLVKTSQDVDLGESGSINKYTGFSAMLALTAGSEGGAGNPNAAQVFDVIVALGMDFSAELIEFGVRYTLLEYLGDAAEFVASIPRITKEEFYTL